MLPGYERARKAEVTEIRIHPNSLIDKGAPSISLGPRREQNKVAAFEVQLIPTKQNLKEFAVTFDCPNPQVPVEEENVAAATMVLDAAAVQAQQA